MHKSASQTGAKPNVRVYEQGLNQKLDIYTPEDTLDCKDKDDLLSLLEWYGRSPFIKQVVPDSVFARRNFVEKIRPALRWYCHHFGVGVPNWLKGDGLDQYSPEEMQRYFGDKPLKSMEFDRHIPQAPPTPGQGG